MESVHQIITVSLSILSLLQREVDECYRNIWASIKRIKSKLLSDRFEEDEYKIYMPGEIYQ
ncbi:hypothetical protein CK516_32765 [Nostoc sp. 'Peltigera malacea cyanobiont' DB3992]|nr:hypothetical protein CK516_32765 [Nostoc sp. 'Peltigera malacea cyanobiont' DB3992]